MRLFARIAAAIRAGLSALFSFMYERIIYPIWDGAWNGISFAGREIARLPGGVVATLAQTPGAVLRLVNGAASGTGAVLSGAGNGIGGLLGSFGGSRGAVAAPAEPSPEVAEVRHAAADALDQVHRAVRATPPEVLNAMVHGSLHPGRWEVDEPAGRAVYEYVSSAGTVA